MQVVPTSLASSFPSGSPSQPPMYQNSAHGMMVPASGYRSFSDSNGFSQHTMEKPQIYTAVYSGVSVYEMEVNRVAVMRRRSDGWLNATQILKVAGVDKGKRTKVLEKEILTGHHEKVQGGYGKYQGTWVSYQRGREFCRQYGVEDILRPLLDYDVTGDGNAGQGIETPTKEQAMAANRKRFYTQSMDGRNQSQGLGGTFFSNISTTATSALAAMNKVARMNSPAPRPGSASQRRSMARPAPQMGSQDSFRQNSQQSIASLASERSFGANGHVDSAYGTGQFADMDGVESQEPPRKRLRQEESFSQPNGAELSMREGSPTEPAESFYQPGHNLTTADGDVPTALPPLPPPHDKVSEDKQAMLTDLFADQNRTDFSNHPAILHLSGTDLDMPIDNTANTALHWAATLARVSLMRLLISKGANMFRGNAAGQSPLISAVLVNNSLDHSCFPETLEILAPLIELRDAQGRTILHHIAVTCAIKGRAASSKYYLEALLEYLVRSNSGNGQSSFDGNNNYAKPIGLMRFMQEMVNARDRAGNTALNLAARIGNRNIISQLMEVQADPTIPNHKGMRPIDFGVGNDLDGIDAPPVSQMGSPSKGKAPLSKVEETSREIPSMLSTYLQQATMQFTQEARIKQDAIDRTNDTITHLSAQQKTEQSRLQALQQRTRARQDRAKRITNLRRWLDTQRRVLQVTDPGSLRNGAAKRGVGYADSEGAGLEIRPDILPELLLTVGASLPRKASDGDSYLSSPIPLDLVVLANQHKQLNGHLPPLHVLRQRLQCYVVNNESLRRRAGQLKAKDGELEVMYRKVVSLATGVEEERIDEVLEGLCVALESDPADAVEVGRVREFLRKVEGVEG
ncbi:apses transcription factor-like protein [Delitschia confertaspora ATCC 74209]|uniref:Transcription factor SWI6 n=1 Tax=Delitschia confertaspora ATCC 74209 TaxID=1513339 RepID=A0A9P4JE10_9PLEO|nr:apses transcription factor-like protein [Delitschia confertaspora ATCC 74209]